MITQKKKPFEVIEVRPLTEWSRLFVSVADDEEQNNDMSSHSDNLRETNFVADNGRFHDTKTCNTSGHCSDESDGYCI